MTKLNTKATIMAIYLGSYSSTNKLVPIISDLYKYT